MEQWTAVPGYEGWYEVSDLGRVRKIRQAVRGHSRNFTEPLPIILEPLVYRKGYLKTHFASCDGSRPEKRVFIHRLVWEAFNGPITGGLTVNHINGIKSDNRLTNLELATHLRQHEHAVQIGLKRGGSLTPGKAAMIRDLHATGKWTHQRLAAHFGVSESMINQLVKRRAWSLLGDHWFA